MREWIANILTRTTTDRIVIDDLAIGIQAAQSRAWIITLLINTSQMSRTFSADETLWTTMRRSTLITRTTGANCTIVHHTTNTMRTAWRWHTRILIWYDCKNYSQIRSIHTSFYIILLFYFILSYYFILFLRSI